MRVIRRRSKNYARRTRKLWNEHHEGWLDGTRSEYVKFDLFLDYFNEVLKEAGKHDVVVDKYYGDCTMILLCILDRMDAWSSSSEEDRAHCAITSALCACEVLFREPKYRGHVKESPGRLGQILRMFELVDSAEDKLRLLSVVRELGRDAELQLEMGRLQGFKRMLGLLESPNKVLMAEVMKTLKVLLDVQAQTAQELELERHQSSSGDWTALLGNIAEFGSLILQRVFSGDPTTPRGSECSEGEESAHTLHHSGRFLSTSSAPLGDAQPSDGASPTLSNGGGGGGGGDGRSGGVPSPWWFIPSGREVDQALHSLERMAAIDDDVVEELHPIRGANGGEQEVPLDGHHHAAPPDDVKEFMRVQGALTMLTESVCDGTLAVQLDLVETVCKLLFRNRRNQHEFSSIHGYSFFLRMLQSMPEHSSEEAYFFLEQVFALLFNLVLDGHPSALATNVRALQWLLELLHTPKLHSNVRLQVLRCLQDLLSVNPVNVAALMHVGAVQTMLHALAKGRDPMFDGAGDPCELNVMLSTAELLTYHGVLASGHNTEALEGLLALVAPHTAPSNQPHGKDEKDQEAHEHGHEDVQHSEREEVCDDVQIVEKEEACGDVHDGEKECDTDKHGDCDTDKHGNNDDDGDDKHMIHNDDVDGDDDDDVDGDDDDASHHALDMPCGGGGASGLSDTALMVGLQAVARLLADAVARGARVPPDTLARVLAMQSTHVRRDPAPEAWLQHQLLILEILGLLVNKHAHHMEWFYAHGGLESLASLAGLTSAPAEARELALWLLGGLAQREEGTQALDHFIVLLDQQLAARGDGQDPLPMQQVCEAVSELMQSQEVHGAALQVQFVARGGLGLLLRALESSTDAAVCRAALTAIGDVVIGCEENKSFVAGHIGMDALMGCIERSPGLVMEVPLYAGIAELACIGSIHPPRVRPQHSHRIAPVILHVLSPRPPFVAPFRCSKEVAIARLGRAPEPVSAVSARPLGSADEGAGSSGWEDGLDSLAGVSGGDAQAPVSTISRPMSSLSRTTTLTGGEGDHPYPVLRCPPLGGPRVRSVGAGRLLVGLLGKPAAQHGALLWYLQVLARLAEAQPHNQNMLCRARALSLLPELAARHHRGPIEVVRAFYRVLASLGGYDVGPEEAALLFALAKEQLPSACASIVLHAIGRISRRAAPPCFLVMDGSARVDAPLPLRFPSARTGYTLSCWIKVVLGGRHPSPRVLAIRAAGAHAVPVVQVCLCPVVRRVPAGAMEDGAGDVAPHKLEDSRAALCVVGQPRAGAPPETFCFEGYTFDGGWHHVALTHGRARMCLYVDGRLVQGCAWTHYPRPTRRDGPLSVVVGAPAPPPPPGADAPHPAGPSEAQATNGGGFTGLLGPTKLVEGQWSAEQVAQEAAAGTAWGGGEASADALWTLDPTTLLGATHDGMMDETHAPATLEVDGGGAMEAPTISLPSSPSPPSPPPPPPPPPSSSSSRNAASQPSLPGPTSPSSGSSSSPSLPCSTPPIAMALSAASPRPMHPSASASAAARSPKRRGSSSIGLGGGGTLAGVGDGGVGGGAHHERDGDHHHHHHHHHRDGEDGCGGVALTSPIVVATGGVEVHVTRALRQTIHQVGGLALVFPFVACAGPVQVAGLRILVGLVCRSLRDARAFTEDGGWCVLAHLLGTSGSVGHDALLELLHLITDEPALTHTRTTRIRHPQGIPLVLDVLPLAPAKQRRHVVRLLRDLCFASDENLSAWCSGATALPSSSSRGRQHHANAAAAAAAAAVAGLVVPAGGAHTDAPPPPPRGVGGAVGMDKEDRVPPVGAPPPATRDAGAAARDRAAPGASPSMMADDGGGVGRARDAPPAVDGGPSPGPARNGGAGDVVVVGEDAVPGGMLAEEPLHRSDAVVQHRRMVVTSHHSDDVVTTTTTTVTTTTTTTHFSLPKGLTRLAAMLELFTRLPEACRPEGDPLQDVLARMMPRLGVASVRMLVDFSLAAGVGAPPPQVRVAVLQHVYHECVHTPAYLDHVRALGGFAVVHAMLRAPEEAVRVTGVKLAGLLLHHTPGKAVEKWATKHRGWDVMASALSRSQATAPVCSTLLSLALHRYQTTWAGESKARSWIPWVGGGSSSSSSSSSAMMVGAGGAMGASASSVPEPGPPSPPSSPASCTSPINVPTSVPEPERHTLVHPEALHVLLKALGAPASRGNEELQWIILNDMERLLDGHPANMEVLWRHPWLDWCLVFQQAVMDHSSPRVLSQLHNVIQAMLVYDISRRSSRFMRVRDLVEVEEFQVQAIEDVIDHFETHPWLPSHSYGDIVKNLVALYKNVEDIETVPPELCMRLLHHINSMACQNSSAVRASMKSCGMFDIRDHLILHLLRGVPLSASAEFIYNFEFESIADQPKFRDADGVLHLLHILHHTDSDERLRYATLHVLKDVLGIVEENRKILTRVMDATSSRLFQEGESIEQFAQWYFSDEASKERQAVQARIQKQLEAKGRLPSVILGYWPGGGSSKAKKMKQRRAYLHKMEAAVAKAVAAEEQSTAEILSNAARLTAQRVQAAAYARERRKAEGAQLCKLITDLRPSST